MQENNLNIVLVEPEIPQNTGSIARLCGATSTTLHLVRPLGFSTDDKYLKRAGLDYWKFVRIEYWESLDIFLQAHTSNQLHYLSKKASKSYLSCTFSPGDFLIFGKETKGLPPHILGNFPTQCYRIPILNPNIRSLNLAMTCGIVLYEALRQLNISD